ncbi:J domain-containing protein [Sphingomonas sp. H39-1-10]|uniref:J domain-containing protein n=1 Tax=Sphingomonas TaxID=13687 RepID=UPI0008897E09|nr:MULTISPECIES: J domain-containing protein [Sphingomonas]MDF0488027.1 J domain-containing protein [Sphingomonas pollutisoli]SDA33065.1 DnaJ domain-containing protein [Sphingomonas sp. NFR15]
MTKFLLLAALLAAGWHFFLRRSNAKPRIDEREARAILGVSASADAETIRAAHRRLVSAVHPDRDGGSPELARRINAARDLLLKR